MKTLDEVEPRTPINAENTPGDANSLFRIAQPGSYYLSANVTGSSGLDGITIDTDDVTIDLNGFALIGVPGSLDGIRANGTRKNLAIENGTVSAWGGDGVNLSTASNSIVNRVRSEGNGGTGISTDKGSLVSHCTAAENTGTGINVGPGSLVTTCTARENGGRGIAALDSSTIIGCTVHDNVSDGIAIGGACTVINSNVNGNGGDGIDGGCPGCHGNTIRDCRVGSNTGDGILTNGHAYVLRNLVDSNGGPTGGACIHEIFGSGGTRIEGNNVIGCVRGIEVDFHGNVIIKNSAARNTVDYDIVGGNDVGPIGTAATSTSPWANIQF